MEGQHVARPPLLTGDNYSYWKNRMISFLQGIDYDVWDIVVNEYTPPSIIENGIPRLKNPNEFD